MHRLAVLGLLVASPALALGGTPDKPILGGTPATAGEFPPVVAIMVGQGLCSGTLIAKDWVLTAGHCVTPSEVGEPDQASLTASVRVFFNTLDVFGTPGMTVMASDTIPDPAFNIMTIGSGDSGLIHLATPVTTITPTLLNFDASKAPPGIMVTMVGYGATMAGGGGIVGTEYTVQQMAVACSSLTPPPMFPPLLDANLLCFNQTDGKGKCQGDSGGPSFAMIGGKLVEVGITSFGDQNCAQIGADTRVDAEKAFIKQHVKDLFCTADTDCDTGSECFASGCIVQPFSPGGLGTACTAPTDCDSGTCAGMGSGGKMECTMSCAPGAANACPAGLECDKTTMECFPSPDGGGCCDASGGPTAMVAFGLCGLVLRRRRRR